MRHSLIAFCADFKTTDLANLGTIAWADRSQINVFLQGLKDAFGVSEAFFLQSCNRREFYFHIPSLNMNKANFAAGFFEVLGDSLGTSVNHTWFRILEEEAVIQHLFRVATSLESMVLGESEIMKQVRDQFADARKCGNAGRHLSALVQAAVRAARRVRTETQITKNVVSMASLIYRSTDAFLREHHRQRVVFVGAGHFMRSILPTFSKNQEFEYLFVSRRLPQDLADEYGGKAMTLDAFRKKPPIFDVLISATSSKSYIFDVRWLVRHCRDEALLVDAALPRDLDERVAREDGLELLDLAVMEDTLARNRAARQAEVPRAIPIFNEIQTELERELHEMELGEIHAGIASYYEKTADRALECLFKQRKDLHNDQRELLQSWSRNLVKRLVSVPVLGLKGVARELGEEGIEAYIRGVSSGSPLFA